MTVHEADEPTSEAAAAEGRPTDSEQPEDQVVSLVDWQQTGRRVGRVLTVLAIIVLIAWLAVGLLGDDGIRLRLLAEFVGLALLAAFAAEVVVVGGAAARGMLRAGERGERLSSSDVSLFPPQLRRKR